MDKVTSLKKRTLAILLAIITVIAYMPMNAERAYAEDQSIPSDGILYDANYSISREDAYEYKPITVSGNATINLNGGVLYTKSITIKNGANLTIVDNSNEPYYGNLDKGYWDGPSGSYVVNGGIITSYGGTGTLIIVEAGGHLTMNGGTIAGHNGTIISAQSSNAVKLNGAEIKYNNINGKNMFDFSDNQGNLSVSYDQPGVSISGDTVIVQNYNNTSPYGLDTFFVVDPSLGNNADIYINEGSKSDEGYIGNSRYSVDTSKFHLYNSSNVVCMHTVRGAAYSLIKIKESHDVSLTIENNEFVVACNDCSTDGTISLNVPDEISEGNALNINYSTSGILPVSTESLDLRYSYYEKNSDGTYGSITDKPTTVGNYKVELKVINDAYASHRLGEETIRPTISKDFKIVCREHKWTHHVNNNIVTFSCEKCGAAVEGDVKLAAGNYCIGQSSEEKLPHIVSSLNPEIELTGSWSYSSKPAGTYNSTTPPTEPGTYVAQCVISYKPNGTSGMQSTQAPVMIEYSILPHTYRATVDGNVANFYCETGGTKHSGGTVTLDIADIFAGKTPNPSLANSGSTENSGVYSSLGYSYTDKSGKAVTNLDKAGTYYVDAPLEISRGNTVTIKKAFKVHKWAVDSNENGTALLKCSEGCEDVIGSIAINAENTGIESVFGNWGVFDIKNGENDVTLEYYDVNGNKLSSKPTADGRYTVEAKITSPVSTTLEKTYYIGDCHSNDVSIDFFPRDSGEGGYYVLSKDIELSEDVDVSGDVHLCLNGHTINTNGNVINVNGSLSIRDCSTTSTSGYVDSDGCWKPGTEAGKEQKSILGGAIIGGSGSSIFKLSENAKLELNVNLAGNMCSIADVAARSTVNINKANVLYNAMGSSALFNGTDGTVTIKDSKITDNIMSEIAGTDGLVVVSGNTVVKDNKDSSGQSGDFKHIFRIAGELGSNAHLNIYRNQNELEVKVAERDNSSITENDVAKCHIVGDTGYNNITVDNNVMSIKHNHEWELGVSVDGVEYKQHCNVWRKDSLCCPDVEYTAIIESKPISDADKKRVAKITETNDKAKFGTEIKDIVYYNGGTKINGVPTLAGTYTARAKIIADNGDENEIHCTIGREFDDATATVTANSLTYTGDPQELVTVANATGTVKYSLDGQTFTTTVPKGTDAGPYKVYYQVIGDDTHYNSNVYEIPVTIAKAQLTDSVVKVIGKTGLKYTGEAQELTGITGNLPEGCKIDYRTEANGTYTVDGNKKTDAGKYQVYYNISEGKNYRGTEGRVDGEIAKADIPVTVKGKTGLVYNGNEQELTTVTGTMPNGLVMKYSTVEKSATPGIYTENGNKKKEAGEYTVYYKVDGGNNYNDINSSVNVTIAKKSDEGGGGGGGGGGVLPPAEPTAVEAVTGLVYTGEAQKLVKGGGKDTLYSLDGVTFAAAIPTGTDAGDYTVTYKQSSKTETLKVTIKKADVKLAEAPLASSITSEKKLSASVLSGGSVLFGDKPVEGTFAWETPDVVPGVSGEYTCIFTPSTGNFNTVTCKVKVTVKEGKAYPLTLDKTGKGTVTISDYEPVAGDEVTIKLAPATGYLIKSVKFTYTSDRTVPDQYVEKVSSKKYILTQPKRRVIVHVVFAKDPTYVSEKTMNKNSLTLNNSFTVLEADYGYDVTWGKVKGADGYIVSTNYCGSKLTTKCRTYVKSGSKTSVYIDQIKGIDYNMKKNVRVYVRAYKQVGKKKVVIGKTFTAHMAAPLSETYTNVKELRTNESVITLAKGSTQQITVSRTILYDQDKKELSKSHSAQRHYYSTDTAVATVSSEGVVTAKGSGTCYVYVRAQNGVKTKVEVNVK